MNLFIREHNPTMKSPLTTALLLTLTVLTGCAIAPDEYGSLQPGAQNAAWKNLGVTPSGNIMNELDELSIRRQGNRVTFRDRKTIFNLKKEDFQGSPRHKTSINTWEIDCARQTYRLQTMSLFDENGRLITRYSYNDRDLPATPITANTASHYQMKQVCPNR